jgi:hypothetical protein
MVSLIMFSRPGFSGEPTAAGQFSQPQVALTNNYTNLISTLWYPPNSGTSDVRSWDANGLQTPRAHGDYDANTATTVFPSSSSDPTNGYKWCIGTLAQRQAKLQ